MSHNQLLAISIFPRFLPWDVRIPVRVIGAEGIVNMMQGVFVHGRCKLPSNIGGERTSCAIIIVMDVAVMAASIVYQRLPVLVVGHMPSLGTNALNLTRGSICVIAVVIAHAIVGAICGDARLVVLGGVPVGATHQHTVTPVSGLLSQSANCGRAMMGTRRIGSPPSRVGIVHGGSGIIAIIVIVDIIVIT